MSRRRALSADGKGRPATAAPAAGRSATRAAPTPARIDQRALGSLEDEVGLSAAKVQVTEKTVDADGNPGPVVGASLDLRHAH